MRNLLLASVAFLLLGSAAFALTPDEVPPAQETICDAESGAAYGLCNTACEAMDCDTGSPNASEQACARVADKFTTITGRVLPCLLDCPCLANQDFFEAVTDPGSWNLCAENEVWCPTCGPDFDGIFFQTASGFFGSWRESDVGFGPAACFGSSGFTPIEDEQSAVCIALIRLMLPVSGLTCVEVWPLP